MVMTDTLLYWIHRSFHHPSLYRFHKQHHEYKSPIPISSEYYSIAEEVGTGFIPTLSGPLLLGRSMHMGVLLLWVAFRVCESADAHSGYDLPFPLSVFSLPYIGRPADRHYFHHSVNVGNFGAFFCFWDWLCGTDVKWREWRARVGMAGSGEGK